jgi:chemotaxis protein MotA
MFPAIGLVIVIGSVVGGYLLEGGNLSVIVQPVEVLIIMGAAFGAFVAGSPKKLLNMSFKQALGIFSAKGHSKESFLEMLLLLNDLFRKARREGLIAIESHVNRPQESSIFTQYPGFMHDKDAVDFLCDNFKVYISTGMEPDALENLMEIDMETQSHEALAPSHAVNKTADSLPGLGIVAAVLGVVLTMGKINEPPDVLGHSIGAALVGTFLGVLACYGIVGPVASAMEHTAKDKSIILNIIKAALLSTVSGGSPAVALEFARRAIPNAERPTFEELEDALRSKKE